MNFIKSLQANAKKRKFASATYNTYGTYTKPSPQFGSITPTLKKRVWDMYVGTQVTEHPCLLCGIAMLYKSKNNGWQAAHVVARGYFNGQLNAFNLVPSCAACNNECGDVCLIDYLYARGRYVAIKNITWKIFTRYNSQHEKGEQYDTCWRLIYDLFGKERYPAGGGIGQGLGIYELIRAYQVDVVAKEIGLLSREMKKKTDLMQKLTETKIKIDGVV